MIWRTARRLLVFVLLVVVVGGGALWWRAGVLDVAEIRPGVFMLSGVGGNVGVLTTDEGVVVVDSLMLVRQGRRIQERVRALGGGPIVALINTHYHRDHTHGNPAFPTGTKVVATDKTLAHLRAIDGDFWADAPARDLLPNETFETEWSLTVGGKTVHAVYPGPGHTDGDLAVFFVEDRVLHAGDLVWNGHWLNVDPAAGGSLRLWAAALDRLLKLDFDVVIPGHGPGATRADVEHFRDFLQVLWRETYTALARGASRDQVIADLDLSDYPMRRLWFYPVFSRTSVIGHAYDEAEALLAKARALAGEQ
jgi:glyoxylase-like metal-dependent hydrolase (beta-lactamase superfamily II)